MKILKYVNAVVLSLTISSPSFAGESDAAIHAELRQILSTVENAINSGDYDAMLPVLSENVKVTPIDQEVLSSRADVSQYFKKWFGANGFLKTLHIKFNADSLTELSDDKSWGVVRGSGVEDYVLSNGRSFKLNTRWTALAVKENDGKWRIHTMHIGTNFLDNPILDKAKNSLIETGVIALLVGLILGACGVLLFNRLKLK